MSNIEATGSAASGEVAEVEISVLGNVRIHAGLDHADTAPRHDVIQRMRQWPDQPGSEPRVIGFGADEPGQGIGAVGDDRDSVDAGVEQSLQPGRRAGQRGAPGCPGTTTRAGSPQRTLT
ncbi:hypothetical protein [Nocardia sp. NPDC020380]|uniref:hypothetical protein n=1 Tax=Nocardia sp. NPDC020380 TaxID=3364309 RepID=UPI0037ABDC1E